ncbi:hypothetical protein SRHO_G00003210 [Serrasalmus rhombeus]
MLSGSVSRRQRKNNTACVWSFSDSTTDSSPKDQMFPQREARDASSIGRFPAMVSQLGLVFEEAALAENASLDVADWSSRVGGDRPAEEGEEGIF